MAERAHPDLPGFKDKWFGLKKSKYKNALYHRYRFCNQFIKDKVVLDIPCGTGWGTSLLKGYRKITGIDISQEAISYASKNYNGSKRTFQLGDLQRIPLKDDSIDVVTCLEGFEHVERDIGQRFISEAIRVLIKGGILIMTCPVLNCYGLSTVNPYHLYEYPEAELIDILNKNFRIISLERIRGPEGPEYRAVLENIKDTRYLSQRDDQ
jgi:ubiquinone/menaquinone biosynthesis C-methylase UbiE